MRFVYNLYVPMERSKRGKNIVVSKPLLNFEGKVSKKN